MPIEPSIAASAPPARDRGIRRRAGAITFLAGRRLVRTFAEARALIAFTVIALSVTVLKARAAPSVVHPLVLQQIYRAGVQLMPILTLVAAVLGLTVVGQTLTFFSRFGAVDLVGTILGTVVVRELGPLFAAALVLARVGTAIVVELATARATGQVETLEILGIDPIHYLVVPRLVGVTVAVLCLTIYLVLLTLGTSYLVVFWQAIALRPSDFLDQIISALYWEDFVVVGIKTLLFGLVIGAVSCFEGLAKPLELSDVPRVTTRAVTRSVTMCLLIDAFFIVYLLKVFTQ